jgi:hypothetical protein
MRICTELTWIWVEIFCENDDTFWLPSWSAGRMVASQEGFSFMETENLRSIEVAREQILVISSYSEGRYDTIREQGYINTYIMLP